MSGCRGCMARVWTGAALGIVVTAVMSGGTFWAYVGALIAVAFVVGRLLWSLGRGPDSL